MRTHRQPLVAAIVALTFVYLLNIATAQAELEIVDPEVTWHTNTCATGIAFPTAEEAIASFQQCSTFCNVWGGGTQANPTTWTVSITIYQTCSPPSSRSDPITQNSGLVNGTGSCENLPGYIYAPPTTEHPFGYCYISLVKYDQTQKPCDTCVGNPIFVGTGNKRQQETDYVGSGHLPLTFRRTYNSSPQFGIAWRTSFGRWITSTSGGGKTTATLHRAEGSYSFEKIASNWVSDVDVHYKLSGSNGGFTVIAPNGDRELYDAYNKVYSVTGFAWAPKYTMTYDNTDAHRLIQVRNAYGQSLNFTYDGQGRLATMTDPASGVYQYGYDANNKLTSVTYPDTRVRQYVYNESSYTAGVSQPNALTGIVDENSARFANFGYSATGHAVLSEHAGGAGRFAVSYAASPTIQYTSTIDTANHVKYLTTHYSAPTGVTVTDALGTVRSYGFSALNGTIKSTGADKVCVGPCTPVPQSKSFDANGNLISETDFNGNVTTRIFDLSRNLETSRTEAYGTAKARTITTAWHANFRLPTQIDEPNRRTAFTHDANGNVLTRTVTDLSVTPNVSRTWTYTYNSFGRVLTENGPRTDVTDTTTYTYYGTGATCTATVSGASTTGCRGQLNTISNALSHVTTFGEYNAHGQALKITDPNGLVATLTYDARQRLTSRSAGGETISLEYWPTGLLKKVTLPDASFLLYTYDNAHRLTRIDDSEGNHLVYTLDAMGNRTKEESFDPSNYLTRLHHRAFNTLNQLWKEIGAANTGAVTTTFGFDDNGNQTSAAAPLSRNSSSLYDELNRLKQLTDPASGVTGFSYDPQDNLTQVTDPRGKVTEYEYNGFGELTEQTSPDTGVTGNTYDEAGNLKTSTDARGKTGTRSYDALNRLTQLAYLDQTISYSFDTGSNNKGRLMQVTDGSGSTSFTYTSLGRVASRTQAMGSVSKTLGYGYNSAGQLTTLTTPSGQTISYGYSNNRIASVTVNSTVLASSVLYDPFGPVRQWSWGNATLAVRTFDQDGNVDQIDSAGLRTYAQDDAFRITGITDAVNASLSWSLGYDLNDRLTSASKTGQSQSFTYDANGNRLTQGGSSSSTYTISSTSNRLSSTSGALSRTYGYDAAGNTTSYGGFSFGYNDAGRMTSVSGAASASYAHNALGQRVKKTVSGTSTYFVYDEAGYLIGEYDASGALIQETVWLEHIPVATLRPNGGGISIFYIHTDHLNTPRRITRPSDNAIVWRWDSGPFGTELPDQDPDGDATLFTYHLRFPGQYFDAETQLSYNYFRDYDPQVGRYVQSDPVGLYSGPNTYLYVLANPVSFLDPTGLTTLEFRVKDGTLIVDPEIPGRSPYEIEATSGKGECENQPKCEKVVNKGPIPRGRYVINSTEIDNPPLMGDLRRNFGTDRSAGGGDWGDWRVRIYPERGTQRYGRTGFYLHGGYFDGSAGCIDIGGGIFGNDKLLKDLLGDPDKRIPLLVR